jgi:hypothetical protein
MLSLFILTILSILLIPSFLYGAIRISLLSGSKER